MEQTVCAGCGATNMGMQTRCLACGADLGIAPAPASTTSPTQSPPTQSPPAAPAAVQQATADTWSDPPTVWQPTHRAPPAGLAAYASPDPSARPSATLEPGLPVERVGEVNGWARIVCSNGWVAWVDASALLVR